MRSALRFLACVVVCAVPFALGLLIPYGAVGQ